MSWSLKTKLRLAILGLVVAVVLVYSWVYLSLLARHEYESSFDLAQYVTREIYHHAQQTLREALEGVIIEPADDPRAVRRYVRNALATNPRLTALLESSIGLAYTLSDLALVDENGIIIAHSNASRVGEPAPMRYAIEPILGAGVIEHLRVAYGPLKEFEYVLPLQLDDGEAPVVSVRVGISTSFVKNSLSQKLGPALAIVVLAVASAIFLGWSVTGILLGPLETISVSLDLMTKGQFDELPRQPPERQDEFGQVANKLSLLGQQFRDVRETMTQVLEGLEEALLLFTRGGRAILASGRVEEFFGKTAAEILGRPASEVFGPGEVADTVRVALEAGRDFPPQEAELRGRRITLEVHFISSLTNPGDRRRQDPVALVRLRDVESVRNLESQLQVSNRLAAISRLTSGVAHEVKNPLNAMVLHLEALKSKLARAPGAAGVSELRDSLQEHIEIIAREAYRLDRVVKTFLDFARPVELNLRETDLNELVREVVSLAETEAVSRNIRVVFDPNGATPRVRVDRDLIKQALLNVVLNGCQAMPHGGTLTITGETQGGEIELAVADEGPGIAAEIRDKVFNLYFTTREKGSGIGLPLAFRAFQLHNGTIAFDNRAEGGAVFRMRLPLAEETVRL